MWCVLKNPMNQKIFNKTNFKMQMQQITIINYQ